MSSFVQVSGFPLLPYLGLSLHSLEAGYLWTLITYPFIVPATGFLNLLFQLGFDFLFIWIFGVDLIRRIGQARFLFFFFGSTLIAGIFASFSLFLLSDPSVVTGPSFFLLALIISWTILHAEQQIQINPTFAFRPFWIFLFLILFNIIFEALSKQWTFLIAKIGAALFSYLFCLLSEKAPSSFSFLWPFERSLLRSIERLHSHKKSKGAKIIDFRTGKPVLDDEQFMDAMLARISLQGEDSLSPEEKNRMRQISEKKRQKNP